MPKIDYSTMPKKDDSDYENCRKSQKNSFYNPDPDYEESEETYRGYYAMDLFGLRVENLRPDKEKKDNNTDTSEEN